MLGPEDALPRRPRRVIVAGVAGSGKTTFSNRIATLLAAPHTEIDGLHHGPNWTPRPSFVTDVDAASNTPAWVIEWQYSKVRPMLAERAELLVWLDHRYWQVTFPRVVRRTLGRRIRREQMWNGNTEPPLRTIVTDRDHIVRWSVRTRRKLALLPERVEANWPHLTLVRLGSPADVETWVSGPLAVSIAADPG